MRYQSRGLLLGALCAIGTCATASPELVSVGARGIPASVTEFHMTPDGRYFVFASRSSALVPDDTNNRSDVFLRDRQTGLVQRVSLTSSGGQANSDSDQPRITPDGRYVVFRSFANNLVAGDSNGFGDIFIRDVVRGTTWRMSVGPGRSQANGPSWDPRISDDGFVVSFSSSATNLDPLSTRIQTQVYVRDERYRFTHIVSRADSGDVPNQPSYNHDLSGDGTFVLFTTDATNMTVFSDGLEQAYVFNRRFASTQLLSFSDNETTYFTGCSRGVISRDGRYAVLAVDEFGDADFFRVGVLLRIELATGNFEIVARDSFGRVVEAELGTRLAVSSDGRYVCWISESDQLTPNDTNGMADVFVRDMVTGTTRRTSFGADGSEANGGVDSDLMVAVSDDGASAYASASTNLGVPVDPNSSLLADGNQRGPTADLVFWDAPSSRVLLGKMAGSRVLNWVWATQALSPEWSLVGAGEFNRDGYADVVAQHRTSRRLAVGQMRGATVQAWRWISQTPNVGWNLVGVGDFSRSGQSSLLFQNPTSQQIVIARCEGTTVLDWWTFNQVPNPGWRVAAVADFDLDGFADVAFQRGSNGQVTIALSQLGRVRGWRSLSQWPNPGWALRAAGDFDGDGKPDLAFQHTGTGQITFAMCDGVTVRIWATVTPPVGLDGAIHQLVSAGSF